MKVNINRQLAGLEDLAFGEGTVEQERQGNTVTITKINLGNLPFSETLTAAEVLTPIYEEVVPHIDEILLANDNAVIASTKASEAAASAAAALLSEQAAAASEGLIASHLEAEDNPHSVTKSQVGLGNVDDTSDANKPISILQQEALDLKASLDIVNEDTATKLYSGTTRGEWTQGLVGFTGCIKIELVNLFGFSMDGMMQVRIKETNSTAIKLDISGRWNASTSWGAYSSTSDSNINVRFARDASKVYLIIGDTTTIWGNTRVEIDNVLTNYNDGQLLSFSISTLASLAGYTVDATTSGRALSGNLNLSTGSKILGDFSNATHANRTMFNANVDNTSTIVGVAPTGSGAIGQLNCYGLSDVNNSPILAMIAQSTLLGVYANAVGTGTYLPMAFFAGGAERLRIETSGNVLVKSAAGLGYGTGSGGTVTQLTSKSTAVTLNKPCGMITMNNASLAAGGMIQFFLNNSLISTNDLLIVNSSGNGNYRIEISANLSGQSLIRVTNITGGALAEALVINFAIIKGAIV